MFFKNFQENVTVSVQDNYVAITSSDIPDHKSPYHGHFAPTKDYPNGIYHYYITGDSPYLNGGQYFGSPGSVTQ